MLVVSCSPATHKGQKRSERSATQVNADEGQRCRRSGRRFDAARIAAAAVTATNGRQRRDDADCRRRSARRLRRARRRRRRRRQQDPNRMELSMSVGDRTTRSRWSGQSSSSDDAQVGARPCSAGIRRRRRRRRCAGPGCLLGFGQRGVAIGDAAARRDQAAEWRPRAARTRGWLVPKPARATARARIIRA